MGTKSISKYEAVLHTETGFSIQKEQRFCDFQFMLHIPRKCKQKRREQWDSFYRLEPKKNKDTKVIDLYVQYYTPCSKICIMFSPALCKSVAG